MSTRPDWMMRPDLPCLSPSTAPLDIRYHADQWFLTEKYERTYARQLCAGCPVINDCLQHALDHPEEEGIWGGTSHGERKQLRKKETAA